jgi:hypothetical protein
MIFLYIYIGSIVLFWLAYTLVEVSRKIKAKELGIKRDKWDKHTYLVDFPLTIIVSIIPVINFFVAIVYMGKTSD